MLQYWLQILAEAAYWAHRCHLVKWRQEFLCHDWSNIEIPPWVCNPLVIAGHLGWVNYRQAENQQPVSPEGHKKKHLNLNRSQENLTRPWTTQVFFFFFLSILRWVERGNCRLLFLRCNSQHTVPCAKDELVFFSVYCSLDSGSKISPWSFSMVIKFSLCFHEYFNKRLVRAELGLLAR